MNYKKKKRTNRYKNSQLLFFKVSAVSLYPSWGGMVHLHMHTHSFVAQKNPNYLLYLAIQTQYYQHQVHH